MSTIGPSWQTAACDALIDLGVRQVAYVPDAGLTPLIEWAWADPRLVAVPLTSEEQGMGVAAGAWLGGDRSVILMQSSGVGNCINAMTLAEICRLPLLLIITMRGEWAEFNPWQAPIGGRCEQLLQQAQIRPFRLTAAQETRAVVNAAGKMCFDADMACAVLVSQRLIGEKNWEVE